MTHPDEETRPSQAQGDALDAMIFGRDVRPAMALLAEGALSPVLQQELARLLAGHIPPAPRWSNRHKIELMRMLTTMRDRPAAERVGAVAARFGWTYRHAERAIAKIRPIADAFG